GIDFGDAVGGVFEYDGQEHGVDFNLTGIVPGDTISMAELGSNNVSITLTEGASFSPDGLQIVAKNAKKYKFELSIETAGDYVSVGRNYKLPASLEKTIDPLFTITPRVLSFTFRDTIANYTGSYVVFVATALNIVDGEALGWEYDYEVATVYGSWAQVGDSVEGLYNAGVYNVTIKENSLFVPEGNQNTILSNYTLEGCTIVMPDENEQMVEVPSVSCTILQQLIYATNAIIIPPEYPNNIYSGQKIFVKLASLSSYLMDGDVNADRTYAEDITNPNPYTWKADWETAEGGMFGINVSDNYLAKVTGINENVDGELNYALDPECLDDNGCISKIWSIIKLDITIVWAPFNQNYYNSQNLTVKNGAPESGNGSVDAPFIYYYNGESAIDAQDARAVGIMAYVKESVLDDKGNVIEGLISTRPIKIAIEQIEGVLLDNAYKRIGNSYEAINFATEKIEIAQGETTALIVANCVVGANMGFRIKAYDHEDDTKLEENYNISYECAGITGTDTCYYRMQARPVTALWSLDGGQEFTTIYNAKTHVMSAQIQGTVPGVTCTATIGGVYDATNASDSYVAEITALSDSNHSLSAEEESKTQAWVIEKKVLSVITWDASEFTYDALPHTPVAFATTVDVNSGRADDGMAYEEGITFSYSIDSDVNMVVVGDYTVTLSVVNDPNYVLDTENTYSCDYEITPRALNITWTLAPSLVYSGATKTVLSLDVSNIIDSDFNKYVDFVISIVDGKTVCSQTEGNVTSSKYHKEFSAKDVAEYGVSLALDENKERYNCYTLVGEKEKTWEITPFKVTRLEWTINGEVATNATVVYSGSTYTASATIPTTAIANEIVNVLTYENPEGRNAGTYSTTALTLDNPNYTLSECQNVTYAWTIAPKKVTSSWSGGEYIYNGQYQYPTLTINGLVASDKTNFNLEFYDALNNLTEVEFSSTGLESCVFNATSAPHPVGTSIDAGSYSVKFDGIVYNDSGEANANYVYEGSTDKKTYIIAPKVINGLGEWVYSINNSTPSVYLHGTTILEYAGMAYTLTSLLDESALETRVGSTEKDTAPAISYENNVKIDAGTYTATMSISSTNYTLGGNNSQTWAISPKSIHIVWKLDNEITLEKEYNGEVHSITAIIQDTDLVGTDTCEVNLDTTSTLRATEVGDNYTASALSLSNPNYAPLNASVSWRITPRPVSFVWSPTSFTYDGTEKVVTAVLSNRVGTDEYVLEYENNSAINAGTYTARVVSISNSNYTLVNGKNVTYNFIIDKSQLSATFSVPEAPKYDGKYLSIILTISGIQAPDRTADKIAFTATIDMPSGITAQRITHNASAQNGYTITYEVIDAGQYTAKITGMSGTAVDNYVVPTTQTTTFTIAKRAVVVEWDYSGAFTYDGNVKTVLPTVTNAVIRDDTSEKDVVTATPTQNTATNAGSYMASVSALSNSNYTTLQGSGVTIDWVINKRIVSVSGWSFTNIKASGIVGEDVMTYNGSAYTLNATLSGVIGSGNVTLEYSNNFNTRAGEYTASVKVPESVVNYQMETTSVTYTISQLKVEIIWSYTEAFTYDGTEKVVTASASNKAPADEVTFTYTNINTTTNRAVNAGTYTATLSAVNNNDYTIIGVPEEDLTLSWTINARSLILSFNSLSVEYDGTAYGIDLTVSNVVGS
ncbi:MAG: hypothetical protein IKB56_03435, partial [Clostridia bacterium]|nr:hypothetical protein [Clostridia bacterium]